MTWIKMPQRMWPPEIMLAAWWNIQLKLVFPLHLKQMAALYDSNSLHSRTKTEEMLIHMYIHVHTGTFSGTHTHTYLHSHKHSQLHYSTHWSPSYAHLPLIYYLINLALKPEFCLLINCGHECFFMTFTYIICLILYVCCQLPPPHPLLSPPHLCPSPPFIIPSLPIPHPVWSWSDFMATSNI